jgi:carbamoyltransferase
MNGKDIYILGIQSFANPDSGASILRTSADGEIMDYVAISEERLLRKKYPYTFPIHSLGYCMDYYGLTSLEEIDALVTDSIRVERWFRSGPAYPTSDFDYLKMKLDIDPSKITIIRHHMAHAASTYFTSGYPESAILIVDGNGSDVETTSYFMAKGTDIEPLDKYRFHGIGAAYNEVTNWILGMGSGGEGKTMGLAPFGEKYERVIEFNTELDGIRSDFSNFSRRMPLSDIMNHVSDPEPLYPFKKQYKRATTTEQLLEPYFSRAAFDVQEETERVLTHLAKDIKKVTGARYLCIAGGVGLNSVANKIVLDEAGFDDVFIFPACSDSGIPLGLSLWGYYNLDIVKDIPKKAISFKHAYTGIPYSDDYTKNVFDKYSIKHQDTDVAAVAKLIADGKVVHWLDGGSEYGPRALGHRSTLADSRSHTMKDFLNDKVKHREGFRPYAPAVLESHSEEYFDLDRPSPYMLLVADVKDPDRIPSVTHVDGTARVQTVTRESNPNYYDLIDEFYKITGVPVILNTSFNDAGEPIVETPEDAIISFLATKIDYLVINGKYLIDPSENDQVNLEKIRTDREAHTEAKSQEYLGKFFPGYDDAERDQYILESNKIAEWHTKYRSVYELEKKTLEWTKKQSRILVIGTPDHTNALSKHINGFAQVDVVGFIHVPDKFDKATENVAAYESVDLSDIANIDCDEILISSWEFQFDIVDLLADTGVQQPVYEIYDNTSRSFLDVLKGKFPVYPGS